MKKNKFSAVLLLFTFLTYQHKCFAQNIFYGMTNKGGTNGTGTIFTFNTLTDSESVVWNFGSGTDGNSPFGDLILNPSNDLYYGMTNKGGTNGAGTIFTFNPLTDSESVVWNFGSGNDGKSPYGNLVWNPLYNRFYGMTHSGGSRGYGTIFSFNPATNNELILDSIFALFPGDDSLFAPLGNLIFDSLNNICYGMLYTGGNLGSGGIISFKLSTNTISNEFLFDQFDGLNPTGDLVLNPSNNLYYGMTLRGGNLTIGSPGTIFSLNPTTFAILDCWDFFGSPDGENPSGNLVWNPLYNRFYGMTPNGGANGTGTIFTFNSLTDSESVVWNFGSGTDGNSPYGNLVWDSSNNLFYGMNS